MKKKTIITILNIISALPLLLCLLLVFSLFVAHVFVSDKWDSFAIVTLILMIVVPIFIGKYIFYSRKRQSIPLAIVGCIPLLFILFYILYLIGITQYENHAEKRIPR